ncbi:hypothetical protein [Aureispira anguillae]|uniref:Uncharacterized protein n=1 Tax=Aureispira anguillae TaxID=2864201 RepID=A0A915YIF0_9BACT|nr:hypothetical protein [Aureispira anguillae]BDS13458.1 hypothetical protein AsAng_0041960 [Aureispira anguillae]
MIGLILSLFLLVASCSNTEKKTDLTNNKQIYLDSLLKQQILSYKLYLDYDSNEQWKLENKHYKSLHKWAKEFRQDTIINKLHRDVIDTSFIIHIQAGMTRELSRETAKKRMEDIKEVITGMIGFNIDYEMEIIKVLTNLKYKEKHDIEITINRLMY